MRKWPGRPALVQVETAWLPFHASLCHNFLRTYKKTKFCACYKSVLIKKMTADESELSMVGKNLSLCALCVLCGENNIITTEDTEHTERMS